MSRICATFIGAFTARGVERFPRRLHLPDKANQALPLEMKAAEEKGGEEGVGQGERDRTEDTGGDR